MAVPPDATFECWDIDGDDVGAALYAVLAPIQLGGTDYTSWERFREDHLGGAYAWLVGGEHRALNGALVSLRTIQKMLTLEPFPIRTRIGDNIGREEWLRLTIDVGLFRFASIRDQACELVATPYEFHRLRWRQRCGHWSERACDPRSLKRWIALAPSVTAPEGAERSRARWSAAPSRP